MERYRKVGVIIWFECGKGESEKVEKMGGDEGGRFSPFSK